MQTSLSKCFATMALLAATTSPALAQHKACLLESRFSMGGITTDIRDCIQANNAAAQSGLKQSCEGTANAGVAMRLPPARITYLEACPAQPQGVCELPATSFHYYKRDAGSLAAAREGCPALGGRWKAG